MEQIRTIKITVEIDTNKQTYREEFDNIGDADEYFNRLIDELC